MMQEVSAIISNDALVAEELSEEEILACLAADSGPFFTVPTKKAKLRESRLQIMDSDDEEDSLDKYLKENQRLQEASLRLEQENDNLAHRLISSKVALRSALDQAEDKVDVLSKDLVFTQHELQVTQDQMRSKEEEATMLKDVFRKELEKADQNIQRSSGIIADYKQICSQLTERLERQQAAHRQEIDSIKSAVKSCSSCSHALDTLETPGGHEEEEAMSTSTGTCPQAPQDSSRDGKEKESFKDQIRELEQELARTKLQMVEAKCKIQELEHETNLLNTSLQEARNNWLSKAFTSLRSSSSSSTLLHLHMGALHTGSTQDGGSTEPKETQHPFSRAGLKAPVWNIRKISWPHQKELQHNQ
ncbi:rab GTPase-activating protein 1-like [Periophthalmus magnuspinnatus]|uniref:rab GTPase-activating protein 1-like n=1 Tax=Periophthalmus magnuspinnatus TaxID=409849 RepID=UPI00145C0631|nr:rab GTPase-activating protein 1-like [Periophthalmus magnuspinnatus]